MEITSHYYALLAMCRICGVNKEVARKIAYASQFVDDAKINIITFNNTDLVYSPFEIVEEKNALVNIATCHTYTRINTFNIEAMINNTAAFHFFPGCKGNSFAEKMVCRENSEFINYVISEFINAEPEQFGMLMHVYADTFAHQGFSGLVSKENDISNLTSGRKNRSSREIMGIILAYIKGLYKQRDFDNLLDKLLPAYGHGQAMHNPDVPYIQWSYNIDSSTAHSGLKQNTLKIDNVTRYNNAFDKIHKKLNLYLEANPEYKDNEAARSDALKEFYEILQTPADDNSKIIKWRKFLVKNKFFNADEPALLYSETAWLKDAFADYDKSKYSQRVVQNARAKNQFENTSWFKFVTGVKEYKKIFHSQSENFGLIIPD